MKRVWIILLSLIFIFGLTTCTKEIFQVETEPLPPTILHHIWRDYAENYGLFEVKTIDWDSVYAVYANKVDEHSTPSQLYRHLTDMLHTLNDRHISLYPASNPELSTWAIDLTTDGTYIQEDFNFDIIKSKYLQDVREPGSFIQFGTLSEQIGYIHLTHFNDKRSNYEKCLDIALNELSGLDGLILDIRDNAGGFDPNAQYVAGRFAGKNELYMTSKKKNGPGPEDFSATREWYVNPTGTSQFTKPIIVLTTASTASAAETFLLALKTQSHIRQLGTTTAGSFSDNPSWEAPNGWMYTISIGDFRAADGKSYEGIGLVPDIFMESQKEDWLQGKDRVLEKAVESLQ